MCKSEEIISLQFRNIFDKGCHHTESFLILVALNVLAEFVHINNQFPVVSLNYFNKNAYVEGLSVGAITILYTLVNK